LSRGMRDLDGPPLRDGSAATAAEYGIEILGPPGIPP
jgi:hypothetical protein